MLVFDICYADIDSIDICRIILAGLILVYLRVCKAKFVRLTSSDRHL